MATSAFKSTSRRSAAAESKAAPPPARRRSHSVSAVSRRTHANFDDNSFISTEFSNSRDNPLFWSASSSSPDKEESGKISEIATGNSKISSSVNARNTRNGNGIGNCFDEQRGRSVTRSFSEKNGVGRSLSSVRGRSVSSARCRGAYESEKEQDVVVSTIAQSRIESKKIGNGIRRTNSARSRVDKPGRERNAGAKTNQNQPIEWSEDDSACSMQISHLDDGISHGSLSEAEDKTYKAAFEDLNAFRRSNVSSVTATNVADMTLDLINPEAVELISEVRSEYAIQLEESEERARKLRADLAIEEHRGQELDRILKEMLSDSDPSISVVQRSCRGRKTSNERKRMSRRLTEEAMAYFDECVSLSTFDSSDFSASEDPPCSSVGAAAPIGASSLVNGSPGTLCCYDQGSRLDQKQVQLNSCGDSGLTATSSSAGVGSTHVYQFSFADSRTENVGHQEDIRSYIKNFERGAKEDVDALDKYYDAGEYSAQGHTESMLVDRVLYNSRIEFGGLLLCGGAISHLPFASVI